MLKSELEAELEAMRVDRDTFQRMYNTGERNLKKIAETNDRLMKHNKDCDKLVSTIQAMCEAGMEAFNPEGDAPRAEEDEHYKIHPKSAAYRVLQAIHRKTWEEESQAVSLPQWP